VRQHPLAEVRLAEAVWTVVNSVFTEGVDALPYGLEGALARDALKVNVDI
jgi:hypothetical protein